MVYPCYLLSRQCLAHAKATLSPCAPAPPPPSPPPPPPPSPLPPGSEQSDRLMPHSPSHGKVPSSLAREGTGVPSSSTHQQWPRCMPLEERHCVGLKDRGIFWKGKEGSGRKGGERGRERKWYVIIAQYWEAQRMKCHIFSAPVVTDTSLDAPKRKLQWGAALRIHTVTQPQRHVFRSHRSQ